MITTGRASENLVVDQVNQQIGNLQFDFEWEFRLVDMGGELISTTNWKYYALPTSAILSRQRSLILDQSTGQLSLEILAALLPETTILEYYKRIEIDRVYPGAPVSRFPYFTGIIDKIETAWTLNNGAIVKIYQLEVFGVLQRCKGRWVDLVSIDPVAISHTARLVGVCPKRRFHMDTTGEGFLSTHKVPAICTYDITLNIVVSPNANMSSPITRGDATNGYTISAASLPATITWGSAYNPPDVMYAEIPVAERFGVPIIADVPNFLILPYGREPDDLYHTKVAANGYDSGNKKITIVDPVPFKSGNSLLDTTQGEWVMVTQVSSGEEISRKIDSVNASGVITHQSTAIAFTNGLNPVENDLVRLATTEMYGCWKDFRNKIVYYKNSTKITAHKRGAFRTLMNSGLAIPILAYNFIDSDPDRVYPGAANVDVTLSEEVYRIDTSNVDNNVENTIREILTQYGSLTLAGLKLFNTADVTASWTGILMKNWSRSDIDLADLLKELNDQFLPPNVFIRDNVKGTITIKPEKQKTAVDWVLKNAVEIREETEPEPVTRIFVMAEDSDNAQENNVASSWYYSNSTNLNNPTRIIDGVATSHATSSDGAALTVTFRFPVTSPKELIPQIKEIRVHGYGFLTLKFVNDPDDTPTAGYLGAYTRAPIGTADNSSSSITIPGDAILRGINTLSKKLDLVFTLDPDDTAGATASPYFTEIEIIAFATVAWSASFTDDDANDATYGAAPPGWKPADATQFGKIWWMPNMQKRESYRYAPTDYLKRILPQYDTAAASPPNKLRANQRHRTTTVTLTGITQQDARDSAEAYADESLRGQRRYHVTAPLFDAAEIGDTTTVTAPPNEKFSDGKTEKNLLLWAINDSGDRAANMANYTFVDYSL